MKKSHPLHSPQLHRLLAKQVTRREFLVHAGLILVAVLGINSLFKNILSVSPGEKSGYGSSPYGQ